jgi:hypothetical protein
MPVKGGGLANYMSLGSLFHPGTGTGTGNTPTPAPINPGIPNAAPPVISPGNRVPGTFGISSPAGLSPQTPGINPNQAVAQKRKIPQPMGSLGFGASPINTSRIM